MKLCKNNFEIYDIHQLFSSVTQIPPQKQANQLKTDIFFGRSVRVGCNEMIDVEVESRTLPET